MTKKIKLTPIQKRCLVALRDAGGIATFTGQDARRLGFGVLKRNDGRGVVIRVYGTPQYFLAQKGLIHRESEKEYANFIITDEGHKAIARTKPERKPGVADALANAWRGGKPGDVPRFVPDDELNTGPRDERGQLRPGEPRTLANRLADLFEHGVLLLKEFRNGETHTLSNHDRDAVVEALRTAGLFEDALNVCQMVAKASMSETRPSRGESSIGWQKGDGVNSHEVCLAARRVIAGARALKSDGGL